MFSGYLLFTNTLLLNLLLQPREQERIFMPRFDCVRGLVLKPRTQGYLGVCSGLAQRAFTLGCQDNGPRLVGRA